MLFLDMRNQADIQSGLELFKGILDEKVKASQPKNRIGNILVHGVSVSPHQFATYLALKGLVTAGNHSPSYRAISDFRGDGALESSIAGNIKVLRSKGLITWETKVMSIETSNGSGGLRAERHIRYEFTSPPVVAKKAGMDVLQSMSKAINRELAKAAKAINKVAR